MTRPDVRGGTRDDTYAAIATISSPFRLTNACYIKCTAAPLRDGWYPSPDTSGYSAFAQRYRARYGADPVRTATLSYDAVALIARLVQTEGPNAFSEQTLTNPSGVAGVDGVFRFRADGTNERGLAVMKVTPQGGEVVSPAPRSFGPAT